MKNNVVGLPLPRRARSVHQRGVLAIDRRSLAVGVGLALVGVQDLRLVEPLQKDAAVAAVLAFAFCGDGLGKFPVQLAIAKSPARIEVYRLWHYFEIAVLDFPFCRAPVLGRPLRDIFSVAEPSGVVRRTSRRILRAGSSGLDDARHGPV